MTQPMIRVPVVCPQCGDECLAELPVADLAGSLLADDTVELHSSCHQISWTATASEREQIREYLASVSPQR